MGKYYRKLQKGIKLSDYLDTKGITDLYKVKKIESYLRNSIANKHLPAEKVKGSLPSVKMISADIKKFEDLSKKYELDRISKAQKLVPITYKMVEDCARGKDLFELYGAEPSYKLISGKIVHTTFTTQEFIDSTKKDISEKVIKLDKTKKGSDKDGKVK